MNVGVRIMKVDVQIIETPYETLVMGGGVEYSSRGTIIAVNDGRIYFGKRQLVVRNLVDAIESEIAKK